jgi:hypothetical protein
MEKLKIKSLLEMAEGQLCPNKERLIILLKQSQK